MSRSAYMMLSKFHIIFFLKISDGAPLKGICILQQSNKVKGTLRLIEYPGHDLKISGKIEGISAGFHGFHIHQYGDLSNGCGSTGGHFNPDGQVHGGQFAMTRHAGL